MSYSAKERDFTFSLHAEHLGNWKRQKNPSWDQTSCYSVPLKWGEWVAFTCAASVCRLWRELALQPALLLCGGVWTLDSILLCYYQVTCISLAAGNCVIIFKRKSQRYLLRISKKVENETCHAIPCRTLDDCSSQRQACSLVRIPRGTSPPQSSGMGHAFWKGSLSHFLCTHWQNWKRCLGSWDLVNLLLRALQLWVQSQSRNTDPGELRAVLPSLPVSCSHCGWMTGLKLVSFTY